MAIHDHFSAKVQGSWMIAARPNVKRLIVVMLGKRKAWLSIKLVMYIVYIPPKRLQRNGRHEEAFG
jgi:hypothetical protein